MRTLLRPHLSRGRLLAAFVALMATTACEREILQQEARPAGPSLVRARSSSQEVGSFGVTGMNEAGDLVGNVGTQAYRWTEQGGLELLPSVGTSAVANDINAAGTAIGAVAVPAPSGTSFRAAIWPAGGNMQLLPLPDGWMSMTAKVINDAGVVAGHAWMVDETSRSFRWSPQTGLELLPQAGPDGYFGLTTFYYESVYDINAAGEVLGGYTAGCIDEGHGTWCDGDKSYFEYTRAVVWKAGQVVVELEFLDLEFTRGVDLNDGGVAVGCSGSEAVRWAADAVAERLYVEGCATSVNEDGVVAGWMPSGQHRHAFRWTEEGDVEDLGTLGGTSSRAADINEAGDVTGWALDSSGARRAFLWTPEGEMQALPPLAGSALSEGRFVNDDRVVGGDSWTGDDPRRATRWYDVTVNVPPGAHAGGPYTGRISGRRYAYDASATTDPDGTRLRFSWDMDADGTFEGVTNNPLFGYTYPAGGEYTIRLVVLDDGGRADTTETTASIAQNVAPVAGVSGMPTSRGEGLPITLTPSVSDASQAVDSTELALMRYRWDWGDGYTSALRISTHAYADQGTYTVRLIVTDAGGLADTVTRTAVIGNLPPTGRLVAPSSVGEGTPFTISATALTDAPADRAAGFQVAFNCGGGFGAYGTATSIVCPGRPDQGSVTVRMRVKDKDGAASEVTRTIPVGNVAPRVTATATGPTTISAGGTFSVGATFTDVAGDAPWRYRIYWGDGTSTPLTPAAGGATITGNHTYTSPGTYTVQVAVADKDGGSGRSAPLTVTVTP